MLLASVFLLCWEYDRFRNLRLFVPPPAPSRSVNRMEPIAWAAAAAGVFGLAYLTRISVLDTVGAIGAVLCVLAGFTGGLLMRWHLKRMPGT